MLQFSCMCVRVPHMYSVPGETRETWEPLELELQEIVSRSVGSEDQTSTSAKSASALSHWSICVLSSSLFLIGQQTGRQWQDSLF